MTDAGVILNQIKSSIKSDKELTYFLIHQVRYQFILDQIATLNLPPKANILDIGAHPLHIFKTLKLLGFQVSGIASKHEPINQGNIKSLNIETDPFPYPNNHFDLVLLTEVIEHLTVNPDIYLKKIKQVLKPKGYLLITTPNAAHLKNRALLALGRNTSFTLNQLYHTKPGNHTIYHRHNREFTLAELQTILTKSDFQIQKAQYFSAYTPFRRKLNPNPLLIKLVKTIGYTTTKLHPPLKDSLFLLARK